MSVCLSARISPKPRARSVPIFARVGYVRGSVLLRLVDDRPHRLSAGRGDGSAQRERSVIYDCLVWSCRQNACSPIFMCCRVVMMPGWLSLGHFQFDCISITLYLLSAKRPLKQFTVGAITTSSGRLFHIFTILLLKEFCRN